MEKIDVINALIEILSEASVLRPKRQPYSGNKGLLEYETLTFQDVEKGLWTDSVWLTPSTDPLFRIQLTVDVYPNLKQCH